MDKDAYIKQLEEKIIQLKKRIEELERLLGMDSTNSSKPPSSDPPGMSAELPRHRRKKRGARNGHEPHLRELLPEKFVKEHIHLKPDVCTCGSTNLKDTDQEPLRHQVVDIPPIEPQVTEYVQHICQCLDCGAFIYRSLPDELKRQHFGPGVLSIVGILTGTLNTSKRKALATGYNIRSYALCQRQKNHYKLLSGSRYKPLLQSLLLYRLAGSKTENIATELFKIMINRIYKNTNTVLAAIDDSPTSRYGPKVAGAGIHRNRHPSHSDKLSL